LINETESSLTQFLFNCKSFRNFKILFNMVCWSRWMYGHHRSRSCVRRLFLWNHYWHLIVGWLLENDHPRSWDSWSIRMLLQCLGWIKMIMVTMRSHRCHSINAIRRVNMLLIERLLLLWQPTCVRQYLLVL
jgi:hypothetical protein